MQRPVGRLTSLTMGWRPLPFDLRGALLRTCSREGLLELENEEYAVSRLGRAQPLLPPALIFTLGYLSPGDSLQLFSLGPIYLLPQFLSPCPCSSIFFFFNNFFLFFLYIYLFIFGCVGSSLLRAGFLQLRRMGVILHCGARASHCGGLSHYRARALGARASVVVTRRLRSCGSRALERRLSSCGARA